MENKKIPYLCGGTLFFLLVQAKKPRAKAREREKGAVDGLKDPAMMGGLILAITGNKAYAYSESLKKILPNFVSAKLMEVRTYHSMILLPQIAMITR